MRTPHLQAIYYPAEASMRTTTSVVSSSGKGINNYFIIYYFCVALHCKDYFMQYLSIVLVNARGNSTLRNFILEGLPDRNCF